MFWSELPTHGRQLTEAPGWNTQIYALVDPSDETIRYVGKTTIGLPGRLALHKRKPLRSLSEWFASLSNTPWIRLITYSTDAAIDLMELNWIAKIRVRHRLLNVDPGGNFRDATGAPRPVMVRMAKWYARENRKEFYAARAARLAEKPANHEKLREKRRPKRRKGHKQKPLATVAAEISKRQMERARKEFAARQV